MKLNASLVEDFKAAWLIKNPHTQTLYAPLLRHIHPPISKTERLELPDGDFIDLSWADANLPPDAPLIICLHGLGGNIRSPYVAGFFTAFNRMGWRAVLMHFRGTSQEPNRLARAYHSGETEDFDYVMHTLCQRGPHTPKAAVGVSLGGNVLLKWLGEHPDQTLLRAATAVSVPYQLAIVSNRINQGFSRIYQAHLLKRLRKVFHKKMQHYPDQLPFTMEELNAIESFWVFDNQITAPLHGFADANSYYTQSSALQYLPFITTPTCLIHALDDPFMTFDAVPTTTQLSASTTLCLSERGGHVGFIAGSVPGKPIYWLEQKIPEYLKTWLT